MLQRRDLPQTRLKRFRLERILLLRVEGVDILGIHCRGRRGERGYRKQRIFRRFTLEQDHASRVFFEEVVYEGKDHDNTLWRGSETEEGETFDERRNDGARHEG